jgi:GTPase SAR1 family protein
MDSTKNKDHEARYKIILVGDVSVGKTAFFWRYINGEFLSNK